MSFIDAHDFPAGLVLRVLHIPTSTYYDWRARRASPSRRELDDAALLEQIIKIRAAHEFAATYGSPRVWLELRRQGVRVGRKRVERLMRSHGLQGAHLRRGWKHGSTRQNPHHTAAPDLVERDFRAEAPNRLWVADLTRLVTAEGVLWLASVRDAFANRIVGWATDPRATTTLVLTALNHALRSRDVRAGQLIHHSDKGAQYTALRFTQRLVDAGVAPSTGSTGDSFDNAWPRTSGPRSRSSSCTGRAPRSPPAPRPSTPCCATSMAGTTRAGSRPALAASHPTSTRTPTIAPSATTPTGNEDSGQAGEAQTVTYLWT
jgi:putative transposase